MSETYEAVRLCAAELISGAVIQTAGVSAGNGTVIDWRTVPSGETIQDGGDTFDTARLFVALVGTEAAMRGNGVPIVSTYMERYDGARRRSFHVRGMTVYVEPHEDDELQAWFTAELARAAVAL